LNDNDILKKWNLRAKRWIKFKPDITAYINEMQKYIFSKCRQDEVLGCYCRGTDYVDLKPSKHPIQPSVDEVINKAKEIINIYNLKAVYLVTEDERVLLKFRKEFGKRLLYIESRRYGAAKSSEDYIWKRNQVNKYINGRDYLTGMMLLSFCDYLIGGVTGGTAGFMLLNEKEFRYKYFWNLGRYE